MLRRGREARVVRTYIAKYSIACKEARETHYWLRLMAATEIRPQPQLSELLEEVHQLVAILTAIIKKCRANNERKA
jgi:four helix bundle protein